MTPKERAIAAFRAMPDEYQIDLLPVLEAVAVRSRRRSALRLVVDNGDKTLLGNAAGGILNNFLPAFSG